MTGEGTATRGGRADFSSARVGGAGFGANGGFGVGGAGLDVTGEEWEGLVLHDTPIRGVSVANSSIERGTTTPSAPKNSQPSKGQHMNDEKMLFPTTSRNLSYQRFD